MEDFQSQFSTENDQIQFHPASKKEAESIFLQLKAEWSFLQEKLKNAKDILDRLSERKIVEKTQEVGILIFVNKALQSIQLKFEAVKIWYTENNHKHPTIPKTLNLRKERIQLIDEYIVNLCDKIKNDDVPINHTKSMAT